jgi:PAS domain S-box-containing protein
MKSLLPHHQKSLLIFTALLSLCMGVLITILVTGDARVDKSDQWVNKSKVVILEGEVLGQQIEGLLATQRGFLLAKTDMFLKRYDRKKQTVKNGIASLRLLVHDNQSQLERIEKLDKSLNRFMKKLDDRIEWYGNMKSDRDREFVKGVEDLNKAKEEALGIISNILEEEYNLLNRRVRTLEKKKSQYFSSLLIVAACSFVLLLISNAFMFYAQQRRSTAERSLKRTEERFKLAIEGTSDGIFDWNLKSGRVFYSRQFFSMLGYDKGPLIGTIDEFRDLLHPEDVSKVFEYMHRYLEHEVSTYSDTFRLLHASGRWTWINLRAKAVFSGDGRGMRMVGATTDITYMKEYQEKLKFEKEQAAQANMAKTEFLAHMSHEIRTPLSAISGIAEIFKKSNDNLEPKQRNLVNILYASTTSLRDLVDDVLDFARIESGEISLREMVFDPIKIFEEVIGFASVNAQAKGLTFKFNHDDFDRREFWGDPTRVRQVVTNLIGNAVKFTNKGSITVNVTQEEREGGLYMRCAVTDTGIGIPEDKFSLIFERFKQADSSTSRSYGGTGLGLSISQNLTELMGGTLGVESEVGKGSTFTLLLPLREVPGMSVADSEDGAVLDKKVNDRIKMTVSGKERVLIIEDYEGNVAVLGYILDEMGCPYDVAHTGREGIRMWQQKHYDLVLMDVQMPEMDGFQATMAIREAEKNFGLQRTPIIGLTAHALVDDQDRCMAAGMDAYLPKPIVAEDLKRQILDHLLRKQRAAGDNRKAQAAL